MEIEIRELNGGDVDAWWQLRLEALEGDPAAFSSSAEDHLRTPMQVFAERLGQPQPGCFVLGAFDAERLVGNMGFVREQREKTGHKGLIWGVYVTPAYRGCGVGRRIMDQVIQRAKTDPLVEQILLSVNPAQQRARRLYLEAGFVAFGREPRALKIGGQYLDEEHLILFLRGDT